MSVEEIEELKAVERKAHKRLANLLIYRWQDWEWEHQFGEQLIARTSNLSFKVSRYGEVNVTLWTRNDARNDARNGVIELNTFEDVHLRQTLLDVVSNIFKAVEERRILQEMRNQAEIAIRFLNEIEQEE